ncbi:hypothetical protein Nepgr_032024 [Nepenthes gracilis]|uniref:Uncharacterized protein n=1 Tax=Nepenthes gracilis TaxID=150966 RepID=A0AAD3Y7Z8_NEPGR|nr:hypothetical protein Nepgr_032024 [Nepenthes gracilis]
MSSNGRAILTVFCINCSRLASRMEYDYSSLIPYPLLSSSKQDPKSPTGSWWRDQRLGRERVKESLLVSAEAEANERFWKGRSQSWPSMYETSRNGAASYSLSCLPYETRAYKCFAPTRAREVWMFGVQLRLFICSFVSSRRLGSSPYTENLAVAHVRTSDVVLTYSLMVQPSVNPHQLSHGFCTKSFTQLHMQLVDDHNENVKL